MKILVADDEFFARKAVLQMVSDWDDKVQVLEAEDGNYALEALKASHLDLVLTDIRMPGLDGIELSAYIHLHYPQTSVIIISGYDDFSYAKEAIRYKVEHYLLKPIDRQELYPLLNQIKERFEVSSESKRELALINYLYGEKNSAIPSFATDEKIQWYQTFVIWQNPLQNDHLKDRLKKEISLSGYDLVVTSDKHHKQLLIILILCKHDTVKQQQSGPHFGCNTIIRQWLKEPDSSCLAVGSSPASSDLLALDESYMEARLAALQSLITATREIVSSAEISTTFTYDAQLIKEWTDRFNRKIVSYQLKDADEMIHTWIKTASEQRFSVYMIQDWFAATVNLLNTLIDRSSEESATVPFIRQRSLFEYTSIHELQQKLIKKLHIVCEQLKQVSDKMDMIENIKKEVDIHYKQRIMLEDLAKNKYFVDPSYLSRLFKRKSGMGFANYLLSVRMEKAKQMLESYTELSVSEVASEVGFNDYSYFIQMYKKCYGETPGKYRNKKNLYELE